ncbi:MAG TPA: type I secretion protein TolC, partial [Sedimenticola sp.]|nr:type I secretion protein TolC [Sedimenticola sp.]
KGALKKTTDSHNFQRERLAIDLTQPIYHRQYWVQLEQADKTIAQAESQYAGQEQDLMVRTAQAYFDVLSAKDELAFAESENEAIKRQLEQSKQRFEVGLIAVTDVFESQARYDQSRANLIVARNKVNSAWEALYEIIEGSTLQRQVKTLAPLVEELPLQPPSPEDIEAWSNTAQQQNLLIQAALYGRDIARQEIQVQRSGHYPTLDLVGSHSKDRGSRNDAIEADNSRIGLQFVLPIYTGGAVSSLTRQARKLLEAAQAQLDGQRNQVNRQVRDAYRGVLDSISAVEAYKAGVASSESSLEATKAGFEVGTRTIIDVLGAERDLFLARSKYATSRYLYILAGLKLKQAAGSLSEEDIAAVSSLLK